MKIKFKDIYADVSVQCLIGEIPIEGTYGSFGYFKVTGTYKTGSAGTPDAYHIAGMMAYAQERYFNREWILDLSELSYVWGDDMDLVLGMDNIPNINLLATVVGPGCMEAISTLSNPQAEPRDCLKDEGTFESVAEAYTYLRSKKGT
jgi:hypothetical protein